VFLQSLAIHKAMHKKIVPERIMPGIIKTLKKTEASGGSVILHGVIG